MSIKEESMDINNDILKKTFEWVWRGSIKDFNGYGVSNADKFLNKTQQEISGLFINKLKTRLREAFGNINYLDTIKTKDFKISYSVDQRPIPHVFELKEIRFIQENVIQRQKLAWYLKTDGNFLPLYMCIVPLGLLREFLEKEMAYPAIELLEEDTVETPSPIEPGEDWGDEKVGNDVY